MNYLPLERKKKLIRLLCRLPYQIKLKNKSLFKSTYKNFIVDLELTNACNANCIMCPRHLIKQIGFMEEKMFKKIILKIKKDEIKIVFLCGLGESLLHPKIVEFIDFAVMNDINPILVTNGLLLNKNMQDKLINKGLKRFNLSIPSINKEIFEKINRGISFEKVMDNIKELIKQKNIKIRFNIVLSKLNENYIEELLNFCRKNNIKWSFLDLSNRGVSNFNKPLKSEKSYYFRWMSMSIGKICVNPSAISFIGYDGRVYLCCNDVKREYKICYYLIYPINEILNLKRKFFKKRIELCNICRSK